MAIDGQDKTRYFCPEKTMIPTWHTKIHTGITTITITWRA